MNTRDIAAMLREDVAPTGSQRFGVVIGIENYRDERLNLRCARADAQAMRDLMIDPECGLFLEDNVTLLLDESATKQTVWNALASLRRKAGKDDTIWLYYAGHAAPEGDEFYWVPHDGNVDDLYATGLARHQIARVLGDIPSERVVTFLDCCHAAATAAQSHPARDSLPAEEVIKAYQGRGRVILAASDGKEKSVELPEHGHGAFTHFLIQGLRGKADTDRTGVVHLDGLWGYLQGKVSEASRAVGTPQTPILGGEHSHRLALSLNPLEFGRRQSITEAISSLVGVNSEQLTTDEGRICLELLRRDARNAAERDLIAEFDSLLEGRLRISTLRRLIDDVKETGASAPPAMVTSSDAVPQADNVAKHDSSKPSAKGFDDCKIEYADDFEQLPGKYQWDRKRTLEAINRWSNTYLGVLSNMADRCEVLDVQAHGYFVWQAKMVLEKREWTEHHRKGINVPNPSGPLEFLKQKPPRVPKLTLELTDRIDEICPDCHGTGKYVCPECFGKGQIQCPKCKGIGAYVWSSGGYNHDEKCQLCNGEQLVPCDQCKGAPRHTCVSCNGAGLITGSGTDMHELTGKPAVPGLWSVPCPVSFDPWVSSNDRVVAEHPDALEICKSCRGTGNFVCNICFGNGEIQCPKCKGIGAYVWSSGGYNHDLKCQLCNGEKSVPCQACKGVPKRPCEVCGGAGVVAVYPAISISRTEKKIANASSANTKCGEKHTIPLATIEGSAKALPQVTATLLERFEGAEMLREALAYSSENENAQITQVRANLRWYPYILCRMKDVGTGEDFMLAVNCTCGTVLLVHSKCPKGEGLWSRLFGWASDPFDVTNKTEQEFMLKQLSVSTNKAPQS